MMALRGRISDRVDYRRQGNCKCGGWWWLALIGCMACGGQAQDFNDASGGGGQTNTGTPSNGSAPVTSPTSTAAPTTAICFGRAPTANTFRVCATLPIAVIPKSNTGCAIKLSIRPDLRLNPEMLRMFFPIGDGQRTEVPYVGNLAACDSAAQYGGWYATNINGGSTEIGLCPCTCNVAHQYAMAADVDCNGLPVE